MLEGLLVAAVVINSAILVAVLVVGFVVIKRAAATANAAKKVMSEIHEELPSTLNAAQDALRAVTSLSARLEQELRTVDDVLRSADRLINGATVVDVAAKAVRDSRSTVADILAGVKEGLRALRSSAAKKKEDQENV
jgi:hypothetical protein